MKIFTSLMLCFLFCESFAELDTEWWRHTIIYELIPFSFKDSDGDGIGDIKGITSKLDHFVDLQIETIYLTPIFQTTLRDMGYDITDYYKIDSRYGTMDDFNELIREMKKRDMKLILDLVINHSGDKHEWFLKSIDKIDPYTNYYVWKYPKEVVNDTRIPPNNWINIFDSEDNPGSAWTWNEKRQQFYFHQFLKEQPDLNLADENVKTEVKKIIKFWLDKGASGFRLDAILFFFEDKEFRDDNFGRQLDQPETMEFIHELRLFLDEYNTKHGEFERIYVAEAHSNFKNAAKYYGNKTYPVTHFPYNFILEYINRPWKWYSFFNMIEHSMLYLPEGEVSAWMIQDHDCRRVGSRVVAEYSDLVTMISMMLPGTVGVYYGQEIAMEDGYITPDQIRDYSGGGDRDPARLLMQWDDTTAAGFSTNTTTFLPTNSDYFKRNVKLQKNEQVSHYNVFKDIAALRKTDILTKGKFEHFQNDFENVYALKRSHKGNECYLVINLDLSLSRVNLTRIMQNPPNEVSIVATSVNAGYYKGFTVSEEILNTFAMRPLSGVVLQTYLQPRK